ncbi:PAS domain-containing protein [Limosilactobacillus difficilis]|uniref:PAS domain-containing protein n=1 Tax=Limosilactobacillus difficilis TaxID=2991838 RepID=UPI0024B8F419|nr:PAS domain-containing protein [Limosilactobacillus difficilis]
MTKADEQFVELASGKVSLAQLEALTSVLPLELDLIDADDNFSWYNQTIDRGSTAGLKKQLGQSVVKRFPDAAKWMPGMLYAFRKGKRNTAEVASNVDGQRVVTTYAALHDHQGHYLGTLVISENVEHIADLLSQHRFKDSTVPDAVTGASSYESKEYQQFIDHFLQ